MRLIDRYLAYFRNRRAKREGQVAGTAWAAEVDRAWDRLKVALVERGAGPEEAKLTFVGWMCGLHDRVRELNEDIGTPKDESQDFWMQFAASYSARFRAEILSAHYPFVMDSLLAERDAIELAQDPRGVYARLMREIEAGLDSAHAAMNQAILNRMKALREAEAEGSVSGLPKSDGELRQLVHEQLEKAFQDRLEKERPSSE